MPRRGAGYRYPHATTDAREHACRMCTVIGLIAAKARDGAEEWGTLHQLPPLDSGPQARKIRNQLFDGRTCKKNTNVHGELSVSVKYLNPDGTHTDSSALTDHGYVLVVRVWPKDTGRKEITRRVSRGESLAFNPYRETQ